MKATIQQLVNCNNAFEDFLTIKFPADVCHQPGDFQSRRIIDEEKQDIYKTFQNNLNLRTSMFIKINWEKCMTISTLINRSGAGNNVSTFQIIASRARKEIVNIKL